MNDQAAPVHEHRVSDMGVVTYLRLRGWQSQEIEWEGTRCYWYFIETPGLLSEIDNYAAGKAQVDPKEFTHMMNIVRGEFYEEKNR